MPPKKQSAPRAAAAADSTQPKQRKPRAPMAKPPGMSNAEWRAEVQRREAVTTDRLNRLNAKKVRDGAASSAAAEQAEASRAGMMNSPGFHAQDDTMDTTGADTGEEREKEEAGARTGEPRVKWTSKEDECLAEAWKIVSLDPVTGVNRNADTYWTRINSAFNERKLVDPYFATIHMQRGAKAMSNHWAIIQTACNKWHGSVEEIAAPPESGANIEGQMVRMFTMYRQDSNDQEFKFLHVFTRIEKCEKWTDVRRSLTKAKETYKPDAPAPRAADGRPDGNKRAKTAKDATPAAERLQSSTEQCIADAKNHAAKREEKSEARWSALRMNSAIKLDLLRTNVAAKKRNTDLSFLMGADMSTMDEQVKAWFLAERSLILTQMPSTTAPTPTPTPTLTPSPSGEATPTPSTEATPTPSSPSTEATPTPNSPSTKATPMPTPASPTLEEPVV